MSGRVRSFDVRFTIDDRGEFQIEGDEEFQRAFWVALREASRRAAAADSVEEESCEDGSDPDATCTNRCCTNANCALEIPELTPVLDGCDRTPLVSCPDVPPRPPQQDLACECHHPFLRVPLHPDLKKPSFEVKINFLDQQIEVSTPDRPLGRDDLDA